MQPPLVRVYLKLQLGQEMPCSARCCSSPAAWLSGLFSSFHRAKSAQLTPSCCGSHGTRHLAHDMARQSGHTSFLFLGSARNPNGH